MKKTCLIMLSLICAQPVMACETSVDRQLMKSTSDSPIKIAAILPEQPIKTGAQFSIDIVICDKISATSQIEIDANMPAHKHGMNYIPEVSKLDLNIYRGSGLFFHMPGQWQITVDLKGENIHRYFLDVTAR